MGPRVADQDRGTLGVGAEEDGDGVRGVVDVGRGGGRIGAEAYWRCGAGVVG